MLTPEEQRRAEEVFELALELSPAEREALIEEQCGDNPDLAEEVRQLIKHYEAAPSDFMQSPTTKEKDLAVSDSIGPYELGEVLGEGGMGIVYRAEQRAPVARTVALKILKLGLDSREILKRFETERQVLADLEHPNIARVYDAGTTEAGRPYFVMEYIEGQAITAYCDDHKLTLHQRIVLFMKLCRGVQHAHQKGIIHRDIKPMNILVAEVDGTALPKVIDFGVAKALQVELTGETLFTLKGQLIGTPEYMSPEQADAASVDTRTDIYSLGAVLYELLVGVLPIDAKTLRKAGFQAMMKVIREQAPQRPSTRVSFHGAELTTVAAKRNVEPRVLERSLRGDLDWIVLKALEKDPDRRYSTVAELAADLDRYLTNQPIVARPASKWYLLGKFVERHRVGVSASAIVFCALIALGVNVVLQSQRVARERDRANHEATVAHNVTDFLIDIFSVADPNEAQGQSITAREILDRGTQRVGDLEDDATRAELTGTLAAVYQNLGYYDKSDSLFIVALDLWMEAEGVSHTSTLLAIRDVAGVNKALGRLAAAESLYTVAVEGWQDLGLAGDLRSLNTIISMANVIRRLGRYAEADSLYLMTLNQMIPILGDDDIDVLRLRGSLAFSYKNQYRNDEAMVIYEDVLERHRRTLGNNDPRTIATVLNLGALYVREKRFAEAEPLLIEARDSTRNVMGEDHPKFISCLESLGALYLGEGKYLKAEEVFSSVLSARRQIFGSEHPATLVAMHNLGEIQFVMDKFEEAEKTGKETLVLRIRLRGDEHPYTQQTRWLVAKSLAAQGQYDEALENMVKAVASGASGQIFLDAAAEEIFDPLRTRPEFLAMVATLTERLIQD